MDYTGDALILGEDALKGACGAMTATFAAGTCTRAKALGSCDIGKGQVRTYYPSEANTAESAKSDCDLLDGKRSEDSPQFLQTPRLQPDAGVGPLELEQQLVS